MPRKGLGRGLGALIPEVPLGEKEREGIVEVDIHAVIPNPKQPRKRFDETKLAELAASIKEHGIVQPIVVRPRGTQYEIVAGERRWRAAKAAGLERIPALVREFSEAETMEIALIENLQREDLNPLEEAEAYRALLEEFRLTQDELAKRLGKSRPQISNTLRLLQLPDPVREEIKSGRLSMGHAKVLLGVDDQQEQATLAQRVVAEGLSVRELEALVQQTPATRAPSRSHGGRKPQQPEVRDLEERLSQHFGTPVKVALGGEKGKIEITFFGEEGLNRILEVIGLDDRPKAQPPRGRFVV
jgi:ParB family chromosome partitioning protein